MEWAVITAAMEILMSSSSLPSSLSCYYLDYSMLGFDEGFEDGLALLA